MIQFVLYMTQDQMDQLNAAAAAAGAPSLHEYAMGRIGIGQAQTSPAPIVRFPAELETKADAEVAAAETEVTSDQQPAVARRRTRG